MAREIVVYQVDAFTKAPFKGNPAAVCLLEEETDTAVMQVIAEEMNLSETAFVLPLEEEGSFSIRWFTPKLEVPLCGHATLAASKVIFDETGFNENVITYQTQSGIVKVARHKEGMALDFPMDEPVPVELPVVLLEAMGIDSPMTGSYGRNTGKLIIHVENVGQVRTLSPDYEKMKAVKTDYPLRGVGVTAKGNAPYDFTSRYFNPWAGVNEDPVTGSVHTLLAAYWGKLLGKRELYACQASERGGEIRISIAENNRVLLKGDAVIVMKGKLYL